MLREENIEKVKSSVSMVQLAEYYGFKVDRRGFMCCPFHNEKTASMKVYGGQKGYFCFGCGAGGDIFSFVMNYENLSFEDSVRLVANVFSIPIADKTELTRDDRKRLSLQRIRVLIASETEKIEQQELAFLAEAIHLLEAIMRVATPYSEIFCSAGNMLPILQGEWDERFQRYCDAR